MMARFGKIPRPDSIETARGGNTYHRKPPIVRKGKAPRVTPPADILKVPAAVAFWHEHAGVLTETGRLKPGMEATFAMLCHVHADCVRLRDQLDSEGSIIPSARGIPMPHPAATQLHRARGLFIKLAGEFGLTSMSDARIPHEVERPSANPLDEFLIHG